jgi:hypothetical protein
MKHKFPSRARKIIPVETEAPRQDLTDVALLTPESSRAVGGVLSAVNGWNTIAVEPTSRNAELFHFCKLFHPRCPIANNLTQGVHEFVVPNLSSIEGTSAPPIYRQNRVPWMIKSPLMPHIAILLASFARCMDRRENVNKCQETLALKVKALALTNEFLAKDFGLIGNDALHAVVHLACLEVSQSDMSRIHISKCLAVHLGPGE